jgi:KTSC domain
MEREPVESSNLASVGYDSDSETLEVEFKKGGAIYRYFNVPPIEHERLVNAHALGATVGTYFSANIRNAFSCEKQ